MDAAQCCDDSFDAIPIPILLLDEEVRVVRYNNASNRFLGGKNVLAIDQRAGDMLKCLNSFETPEGCGYGSACKKCIIRKSVTECFKGQTIVHRKADLVLKSGQKVERVTLLLTVTQLHRFDKVLALLMLEDVTNLFDQKDVVPVCMHCRKLRGDDQNWHTHEEYLDLFLNIKLSHCICSLCLDKFYPELSDTKNPH